MFLIDYPPIRGEDSPDYSKKSTCNILHTYIDVHNQILIDEYPVDVVHAISRLKPQCENMTFSEKSYIIDCLSK